MNVSDESPQDFLTELQRLALEAYPDIQARAAAGGRPAVNAENRAQERNRRVREAFINGRPIKMKRFLMTQPEDMAIEELCTKVSSRLIVDRLYPEDDDTAFNEVSNFTTKQLLTDIHELSKAQDTLKDETGKLSTELQQHQNATINQLAATQNNTQNNNNNNNNNKNRQNWNKNFGPRGNNQQQWRNNNNNQQNWKTNQQNWKNNNNQNIRSRNPKSEPQDKIGTTTTTHTLPNLDKSTATTATSLAISSHNVGFAHNKPMYQPCPTTILKCTVCAHTAIPATTNPDDVHEPIATIMDTPI